MQDILLFLQNLVARFTARSFVLTFVVVYLVATRPDMSIEQIIALLGALGFTTARAIAEDRTAGVPPVGTEIAPEDPTK